MNQIHAKSGQQNCEEKNDSLDQEGLSQIAFSLFEIRIIKVYVDGWGNGSVDKVLAISMRT